MIDCTSPEEKGVSHTRPPLGDVSATAAELGMLREGAFCPSDWLMLTGKGRSLITMLMIQVIPKGMGWWSWNEKKSEGLR